MQGALDLLRIAYRTMHIETRTLRGEGTTSAIRLDALRLVSLDHILHLLDMSLSYIHLPQKDSEAKDHDPRYEEEQGEH